MDKTDWKSLLNETCFIDDTVHKVLVTGCSQLPDLSGKSTTDGFAVKNSVSYKKLSTASLAPPYLLQKKQMLGGLKFVHCKVRREKTSLRAELDEPSSFRISFYVVRRQVSVRA